jgi:hypothetical protein
MAKQNINVGTAANDKKGDSLRAAFQKVNANFTELYTELGLVVDANLNLGAFEFAGSTLSTTDSSAIVIDQAVTVSSNLTVGGDVLPSVTNGGDLGSAARPWRSLYVSNNTIFLGGTALSVNGAGNLLVNGSLITGGGVSSYADLSGKPTLSAVATTGAYADLTGKPTLFSGSYADLTNKPNLAGTYQFSVAADDSTQRVISTDEVIKFRGAGGITTASDAEGNITITGSAGSVSSLVNGAYTASLGNTGALTLPAGGIISEGGGLTGAIKLRPAGGANANQALLIYPTAGAPDGDHVHLTAGGGSTELYLGNDTHYVKLVDGGNVEVRASTANLSAQAAWTFETDGELDTIRPLGIKVPNGVPTDVAVINSTSGSWELNPRSDLATTGGSGSGLTVNVTETGGYASTIAIAEIAGTGYLNGDVITVTSGTSNATFTIVIGGRNTWQFGTDRALTLPSGTSNIQSVQQNGYQSKVTVSPFRILSQARRSQTQSYSMANEDFTTATSDGNGMIAFVGLQGGVAEFITDTMENGGVYERTVRLNGAGPEYGYSSFNDADDQVFLVTAAPAGAVTEIRFSYTRISKIDIEPDEGVFRIESEPTQDIDIQSGEELRLTATDRVDIDTGTNMRLRAGDGSVQITTNFQVPGATTHQWEFTNGGRLLFPNNTTLKDTVGNAIAFGYEAGLNSQGAAAIAIGTEAGYTSQGANAVAVGAYAGGAEQGVNSIAIGYSAGYNGQAANSIVINATGNVLNQATPNTFTVAPIRNISATSGVLQYNASTKEVSYSNSVTAERFNTDQITVVGNRITTTVTNANLELECNGTGSVVVNGGKLINGSYSISAAYNGIDIKAPLTWKEFDTDRVVLNYNGTENGFVIGTNVTGVTQAWFFYNNGRTKFPTATAPAHSYGAAGDVAGMVAFDGSYIYYCTANYVNNSTNIWKRVALDATPW